MEEQRLAQLEQQRKEEEERRIEEEAQRKREWEDEQDLLRRADAVRMRRAGKVTSEGENGPAVGINVSSGGRDDNTGDAGTVISKVCYFSVAPPSANNTIMMPGLSRDGSMRQVQRPEYCLRRDEQLNLHSLPRWALQMFQQWQGTF